MATKALHKDYESYERVSDKAGVRAVMRLDSQVSEAVRVLHSYFGGEVEDKRLPAEVGAFDYRSVHLQIHGLPDGRFEDMGCEIQVRTVCQDAWAVMSHAMSYKAGSTTPDDVLRGQAALSAVFELADREYERQYHQLLAVESSLGVAVQEIVTAFRALVPGQEFDEDLAAESIEALALAYPDESFGEIARRVSQYASDRGEFLAEVYNANQSSGSLLLYEPLSLIVAERLAARSMALRRIWETRYPVEELARLADHFGFEVVGAD